MCTTHRHCCTLKAPPLFLWFLTAVSYIILLYMLPGITYFFLNPFEIKSTYKPVPIRPNISVEFLGRLGNHLFQYAALVGIAHRNNRHVVFKDPRDLDLKYCFTLHNRTVAGKKVDKYYKVKTSRGYDARTEHLKTTHNIQLQGFFHSFRFFENITDMLLSELTFLPAVKQRVRDFLERVKPGVWNDTDLQKVGIHVRAGDFLKARVQARGLVVPSRDYFQKAMVHMRQQYNNVLFVVTSNDIAYAQQQVGTDTAVYSTGLSPCEDLALLASCDHMIVSSGSYSWWAGWLANGSTVYFKGYPRPTSPAAEKFISQDYYPSHWIPMM